MPSWPPACLAALLLACSCNVRAEQQTIPLYPSAAPGSEGWTNKETMEVRNKPTPSTLWTPVVIRNVARPTLTVYEPSPAKRSGIAAIICPGGGGILLDWTREGTNVAQALVARGVTAFLLKYRVAPTPQPPAEFKVFASSKSTRAAAGAAAAHLRNDDLRQAIRLVRQRAADWKVNPDRIGVMGFSAGGAMVIDAALEHDTSSRPDFVGAFYGGEADGRALPKDAPPVFLAAAQHDDEDAAPSMTHLFLQWHTSNLPAELHLFTEGASSQGGHFVALTPELPMEYWIDLFAAWLSSQTWPAAASDHQE